LKYAAQFINLKGKGIIYFYFEKNIQFFHDLKKFLRIDFLQLCLEFFYIEKIKRSSVEIFITNKKGCHNSNPENNKTITPKKLKDLLLW
jgi:hypothetical protein